jgi:hypothetical protein
MLTCVLLILAAITLVQFLLLTTIGYFGIVVLGACGWWLWRSWEGRKSA